MTDVRVPIFELELAWQRFHVKWPHKDACNWPTFLGCVVMCTSDREGYWATEEGYRKIMALNGPHWKTIIRVMALQYEDKVNGADNLR
jgi:hypothetical protein